jgi:AbrB family looped-hinge helix DNA binding protein
VTRNEQAGIAVVGDRGQVVIPRAIRQKVGIGPMTKLLVYAYNDAVIMKKIEISDVASDLKGPYTRIDKKVRRYGPMSDKYISGIVSETRRNRSS